jgi:hypothetical protein
MTRPVRLNTWVVRSGDLYLVDFKVGLYRRIEEPRWHTDQGFAFRFHNRNGASSTALGIQGPQGAAARVIRLLEGGLAKRITALEEKTAAAVVDIPINGPGFFAWADALLRTTSAQGRKDDAG